MKMILMNPNEQLKDDDGFNTFLNKCLFMNYEFLKFYSERERGKSSELQSKLDQRDREIVDLRHQIKKLEKVRYLLIKQEIKIKLFF